MIKRDSRGRFVKGNLAGKPFQKGHKGDEEFERKRKLALRGREFSKETREKIGRANSKALKEYFKIHEVWNKGKNVTVPHLAPFQFKKGSNGEMNKSWKGGRYKDYWGYVFIYAPYHPKAMNGGYVREHRLVMEKFLGRYLEDNEVVHHKNGIKDDNRLENLEVMSDREHKRLHSRERKVK